MMAETRERHLHYALQEHATKLLGEQATVAWNPVRHEFAFWLPRAEFLTALIVFGFDPDSEELTMQPHDWGDAETARANAIIDAALPQWRVTR